MTIPLIDMDNDKAIILDIQPIPSLPLFVLKLICGNAIR
ncbi:MAG: hypothetical protein ACJAW3_000937 [Lentimonas sp.]|jgi:hypothetical protein